MVSTRVQLIIPVEMTRRVDRWRGQQPDVPNRSKAIRCLLEIGLAAHAADGAATEAARS